MIECSRRGKEQKGSAFYSYGENDGTWYQTPGVGKAG